MDSNNIVMIGKQQIELRQEEVSPLPEDGLLVRTRMSLISTCTECICYRGDLEEGTHWAGWVKYPLLSGQRGTGRAGRRGRREL
jgi:hypothetical protein